MRILSAARADDPERALAERGVKRVALFGTRSVVESDLYAQLTVFTVVRPKPPEIDVIHDTSAIPRSQTVSGSSVFLR